MTKRPTDDIRRACGIVEGMRDNEFAEATVRKAAVAEACDMLDEAVSAMLRRHRAQVERMADGRRARVARMRRHIEDVQCKCRARREEAAHLRAELAGLRAEADAARRFAREEGRAEGRRDAEAEMHPRLMPEGYEWPRYESGEPLRYEDRYVYDGREREVWHVDFDSCGEPTILNKDGTRFHPDKGERVERPAPKALDADEVPIKEGDTVYYVDGREQRVNTVARLTDDGCVQFGRINEAGYVTYCEAACIQPNLLTHRAPVLAADGRPLREGETVWDTNGDELVIGALENGGHTVTCRYVDVGDAIPVHGMWSPSDLTHELPDSWERIEEDAGCTATKYNERRGTIFTTKQQVARDLVRRCRALAERERGQ